jgi:hypothetical protein
MKLLISSCCVVNDILVGVIDDLIKFNEIHNITGHKIGLLLFRDPRQSGLHFRMKEFSTDILESKKEHIL